MLPAADARRCEAQKTKTRDSWKRWPRVPNALVTYYTIFSGTAPKNADAVVTREMDHSADFLPCRHVPRMWCRLWQVGTVQRYTREMRQQIAAEPYTRLLISLSSVRRRNTAVAFDEVDVKQAWRVAKSGTSGTASNSPLVGDYRPHLFTAYLLFTGGRHDRHQLFHESSSLGMPLNDLT